VPCKQKGSVHEIIKESPANTRSEKESAARMGDPGRSPADRCRFGSLCPFHHVLPRDIKTSGESLPRPSTTATSTVLASSSQTEQASSGETSTAESTAVTTANGTWGAKFAGKFTDGSIEKTSTSYKSANINIKINKVQADKVTYYVADIYLRDLDYFRTAFAGGSYAHGRTATVPDMAAASKAILAINGDYYGIRDLGVVIRNGELYRETMFKDVLLMNYDGSMQTFTAAEFDIGQVKAIGAWQAWSFGPMLLDGGQPMTKFNSDVPSLNPRSAIGYFEPGHYCFVLVDGRQDGYSIGMTLTQLSKTFYDLGCKSAYNLDGGQSSVLFFIDGLANQPYRGGRQSSDIIYIAEPG
jgi:exopolysaccharide biosynthesis protein